MRQAFIRRGMFGRAPCDQPLIAASSNDNFQQLASGRLSFWVTKHATRMMDTGRCPGRCHHSAHYQGAPPGGQPIGSGTVQMDSDIKRANYIGRLRTRNSSNAEGCGWSADDTPLLSVQWEMATVSMAIMRLMVKSEQLSSVSCVIFSLDARLLAGITCGCPVSDTKGAICFSASRSVCVTIL